MALLFGLIGLALGWVHVDPWRQRARAPEALCALLVLDAVVLFLTLTALVSPLRFEAWMQEDAWVEWCTFYAFLFAGLLRFNRVVRGLRARSLRRVTAVASALVGLFCVAVAGEEISWGQRIFAFKPPSIFLESNFQQELNLHNILKGKSLGGFKLDSRYLVALIAGVYGLLLPAVLRIRSLAEARRAQLFRDAAPRPWLMPYFAAVMGVSLVYPIPLAGEAVEWVLGCVFLVDSYLFSLERQELEAPRRVQRWAEWTALMLVLGLLTPVLLERLVFGTDEERTAQARADLALLAADLPAASETKLTHKRRVHKRLFTATRDGYFRFGSRSTFLEQRPSPAEGQAAEARTDRKGYFLDPWNNPYWIESRRARNTVLIYSFGPNRRRDSAMERHFRGFIGDDIGIEVPLTRPTAADRPEPLHSAEQAREGAEEHEGP